MLLKISLYVFRLSNVEGQDRLNGATLNEANQGRTSKLYLQLCWLPSVFAVIVRFTQAKDTDTRTVRCAFGANRPNKQLYP